MRLLEPVHPGQIRRALVTILDEQPNALVSESAFLSEAAVAREAVLPDPFVAQSFDLSGVRLRWRVRSYTAPNG